MQLSDLLRLTFIAANISTCPDLGPIVILEQTAKLQKTNPGAQIYPCLLFTYCHPSAVAIRNGTWLGVDLWNLAERTLFLAIRSAYIKTRHNIVARLSVRPRGVVEWTSELKTMDLSYRSWQSNDQSMTIQMNSEVDARCKQG